MAVGRFVDLDHPLAAHQIGFLLPDRISFLPIPKPIRRAAVAPLLCKVCDRGADICRIFTYTLDVIAFAAGVIVAVPLGLPRDPFVPIVGLLLLDGSAP